MGRVATLKLSDGSTTAGTESETTGTESELREIVGKAALRVATESEVREIVGTESELREIVTEVVDADGRPNPIETPDRPREAVTSGTETTTLAEEVDELEEAAVDFEEVVELVVPPRRMLDTTPRS